MEKANSNSSEGKGAQQTQCERDVAELQKKLKAVEIVLPSLVRTSLITGGVLGFASGTLLGVWIGGRKRS